MTENSTEQRVYIACLASYNNGILHGKWIDLPADDLWEQVNEMLEESSIPNAEEWALHDYEGFQNLSEYEDLDELNSLAQDMEELGQDCVNAFIACFGEWDKDKFEASFQGDYSYKCDPELEFSQNMFDELYAHSIPEGIRFYIDYEAFKTDLFINDYTSHNGHIFNLHF